MVFVARRSRHGRCRTSGRYAGDARRNAFVSIQQRHQDSSAIKGARAALRELRAQSRGRPLRVFYAFDPVRQAVLLIGGDKTGGGRFYERMVPLAERIWARYLKEIGR